MWFSQSNRLVLSLMIFYIQDLIILVLCSGKVYLLLKLRYWCGCCYMVVWVPRNFLPTEELLIIMMLVVLFVVWKLRPLTTFLFIVLWLGDSGIVLCNGLGMIDVCQRLFKLLLQEWNHLLHRKFQHKAIYTLCCGILQSIWITRNKLGPDVVHPN